MTTELKFSTTGTSKDAHGQHGFSLVEVLVAAAVFSLGLTGLSLMLLNAAHGSTEAWNRTTAAMHAASLAELISLSPAARGHFLKPPGQSGGSCFAANTCSRAGWAASNLARWQYQLEQSLAGAKGLVCLDATPDDGDADEPGCDGGGGAVVKIFWVEHHRADGDDGRRRILMPVSE